MTKSNKSGLANGARLNTGVETRTDRPRPGDALVTLGRIVEKDANLEISCTRGLKLRGHLYFVSMHSSSGSWWLEELRDHEAENRDGTGPRGLRGAR